MSTRFSTVCLLLLMPAALADQTQRPAAQSAPSTPPAGTAGATSAGATTTAATPAAQGNAENGARRSAELYCPACHGQTGSSETPEWPSIAGQTAPYIDEQLRLLRSRARAS